MKYWRYAAVNHMARRFDEVGIGVIFFSRFVSLCLRACGALGGTPWAEKPAILTLKMQLLLRKSLQSKAPLRCKSGLLPAK
jgi:hypothetical protein